MERNQLVDNNTYNVMQAFVSTLEALEVYRKYGKDGNEQLWNEVYSHTEQVARILAQYLPQAMQSMQSAQGTTASQSGNYATGSQATMGGNSSSGSQSGTYNTTGQTDQRSNYGTGGQTGQSGNYNTGNQSTR